MYPRQYKTVNKCPEFIIGLQSLAEYNLSGNFETKLVLLWELQENRSIIQGAKWEEREGQKAGEIVLWNGIEKGVAGFCN